MSLHLFLKEKNVISLIFSFAMLGIIGYFALSALQSGDESSIGVTLAKQITGLYPISRLFMSYYNFPMYYGMGFLYSSFNSRLLSICQNCFVEVWTT